ncbi:MAG: DUF624 domain-containing protein [Ruminococcaceae bacterium]|nr:DUF624 domain-containing protein [Oscillospiraceae bacterium]
MSENDNRSYEGLSLDEIEELEEQEKRERRKQERREKFNIFNRINKDGKGVEKDEEIIADNPTLKNFFKLVGRKINQLLTVNIMMVLGNFPIFFLLLFATGYFSEHTTAPLYTNFAPLQGAALFNSDSPAIAALMTMFGRQGEVRILTTVDYVLLALGALVVITFGLVRVGLTYILRNMFRGEPVFMWHDFWYAIKRNLRQGITYGIIDLVIVGLLIYDTVFFNLNYNANMMMSTMFFMTLCMVMLYFFMRHYIYLMLVTFDMSISKMFKNALKFTVLGLKRNLMLLLGTVIMVIIEYIFMIYYLPLGMIIPFIILPSLLMIMGVYAAYPKIKEIMIDPYYEKVSHTEE